MPSNKRRQQNKVREVGPAFDPAGGDGDVQASADKSSEEQALASSLLVAVAEQNVGMVVDHLARGDDPNTTPVKACTPLVLAIKLGNYEIVKLLVENGANCNESGENGMTVLHHAALQGSAEIAYFLCKVGGAALDQFNQAGCTPLYQAVQHGHTECARTFLDMDANIEARTRSGATPLYIAADRGNLDLVDLLLDAGCDANVRTELQMTPLLVAAFNGHTHVVNALLDRNVDIEQRGPCGGTALYVAAQEGRQSVAELLIQRGAKVDASCSGQLTPSLIGAMQGHGELVRLLLKAKGDLEVRTEKGSTLAIMAARHGQTEVLKVLVEVGGVKMLDGQNSDGLSVLGAAKTGRHKETMTYIEGTVAAQMEADLSAWEASLPSILEELAGPGKEHTKAKTKRKGKVNGKRQREASKCAASFEIPELCTFEPEAKVLSNASETHTDRLDTDETSTLPDVGEGLGVDLGDVSDAAPVCVDAAVAGETDEKFHGFEANPGPWMQVGRLWPTLPSVCRQTS